MDLVQTRTRCAGVSIYLLEFGRQLLLPEPFTPVPPPPLSRWVTAATDVVMMGGGGRRTGAGARRLSIENERNTLRGLLDVGAGGCTDVITAAAAELSVAAAPCSDADVTFPALSSCPLFDVTSFC